MTIKTYRRIAALVLATATVFAAAVPVAARACEPSAAESTVTYAFYATTTGQPSSDAPSGWHFSDNTDFEDDSTGCQVAAIAGTDVRTYVCVVPLADAPDDTTNDTHVTDDGEIVYADGSVLEDLRYA